MAGGLMQLTVYGSEDIFLTGTPQITFFKIVYRRHTNFSVESIPQNFLGPINFGQEMTSIIEKNGDLMGRVYLQIDIPSVNLQKNIANWSNSETHARLQYEQIKKLYQLANDYFAKNRDMANKLNILLKTNNISLEDIVTAITNENFVGSVDTAAYNLQTYIADPDNQHFNSLPEMTDQIKTDLINMVTQSNLHMLALNKIVNEQPTILRKKLLDLINYQLYPAMSDLYEKIYTMYLAKEKIYQSFANRTYRERYQFAWVEELGHAIIDYVSVQIGNKTIDKQTGDWLIVFNKLFLPVEQTENYYRMIGNVEELITFDNSVKNRYRLIIPFQFWFCRHNGLYLPLISLRYHDVVFNVKLKELTKLCYIEKNPELLDIPNIQSQYNINLDNAQLYVDYIFLDLEERRRFAQTTHEYLIETVQYEEIDYDGNQQFNLHLNFAHPTKFVVWYAQPMSYRENPNGDNKCQWNNFGTKSNKTISPFDYMYLRLNNNNRTDPDLGINYYNYLQPYWYFISSPTDGLNVYSFGIKPTELQPAGTLNLSRIDDFGIVGKFTDDFMDLVDDAIQQTGIPDIHIGVYVMSYNILRFASGMAGLAFENSY